MAGDVFVSRKIKEEGRVISILSDGLASGVKASVLANLTATMAMRYTSAFVDVRKRAGHPDGRRTRATRASKNFH